MVKLLNDYVHQYDLNYVDILDPIKEEILQTYYNYKRQNNEHKTDFLFDMESKGFKEVNFKLNKLIEKNYFVGEKLHPGGIAVYIQDNKNNTSILHNHISEMSTIGGVFYLNIPQKGGEILFRDLENNQWGDELIIKPELNKVYVFPYWLPHAPLPQQDETPRICFNWRYGTTQRPIHKYYLIKW